MVPLEVIVARWIWNFVLLFLIIIDKTYLTVVSDVIGLDKG